MTKLSAIVVGSGWGAHSARGLAADDRVHLAALVGRGSDRTVALSRELGAPVEPTLDDALRTHAPEIVVLAVGERAHEELATRALGAGCHVLCAHPVAPDAAAVRRIADAARAARRLAVTDYTFRLRPELDALRDASGRGALMRVAIDAPGRWLPIVLDTAVRVAGPVARLTADRTYPPSLADRFARAPEAFPPAVQLEHASGAVTSVVTFPHSWPAAPVHVRTSWERARVEALLPVGGARSLALGRSGAIDERELVAPTGSLSDASSHAGAMQSTARAFVDEIVGGPGRLASLEEEAHLRAVWGTLWRASRERVAFDVPNRD